MKELIKNIPMSEAVSLAGLVEVAPGKIVSRTFVQRPEMTITLFSFAAGEGVSTHSRLAMRCCMYWKDRRKSPSVASR